MNRRTLLRGGAGTLIVGATSTSGCSTAMPPAAVSAWTPAQDDADPRHWVLAHAVLAPSAHNLQPWRIDLRDPRSIVLYQDMQRLLPETDPFQRQLMMSHGTFLELVDIAGRERGFEARITYFPDGDFDERQGRRPIARIDLVENPRAVRDPLFSQIVRRRTNRSIYSPAEATPDQKAAIRAAVEGRPVTVGFTHLTDVEQMRAHRSIAKQAWRIELTSPGPLMESYRLLRIGPDEIAAHRDGVSLNDPLTRLGSALGFFDRTRPSAPDSYAIRSQIDAFDKKIDGTPCFFWLVTRQNDRVSQIEAGRAYMRAQLAATAQGQSMHPLQQALQEYPEQAVPHAAIRHALGLSDPQATIQMWARLGAGPAVEPAPRRGLDAHLLA